MVVIKNKNTLSLISEIAGEIVDASFDTLSFFGIATLAGGLISILSNEEKKDKKDKVNSSTDLINKAKGDRSIREFAKNTNTNFSNVSRVLKEEIELTPSMAVKLTAGDTNPQSNISLSDVLGSMGYSTDNIYEVYNNVEIQKTMNNAKSILINELFERGIVFKQVASKQIVNKPLSLELRLFDQEYSKWHFDYLLSSKFNDISTRLLLGNYMFYIPKEKEKISIVIDDGETFTRLIKYKDEISFDGDLSVIYINIEKSQIIREVYLSKKENCKEILLGGRSAMILKDLHETDMISFKRNITCPKCTKDFEVDLNDYVYDQSSDECPMGCDTVYNFDTESDFVCPHCGRSIRVKGWIREYPIGAYDSEDIIVK